VAPTGGSFSSSWTDLAHLDGRWRPLGKGDVVYFPGDAVHGARNCGTVTCRVVWVFPTDTYEEIECFDD